MRTLTMLLFAAGLSGLVAGCATPAYSGGLPTIRSPEEKPSGESANTAVRAWYWDTRSLADDVNAVLLLESPSRLTKWNIR